MRLAKLIWLTVSLTSISGISSRTVLVVSNVLDDPDTFTPVVEVYDFLSRTWRLFDAPLHDAKEDDNANFARKTRKPNAARLINQDSLLELDLSSPSMRKAALPTGDVEGAAPFNYGDTLCLAGGYNRNTSELLRDVVCWNPLEEADKDSWVPLPKMRVGRYKAAAVVLDGKLFVTGGYDPTTHKFIDSVEVFDDLSQRWYDVSPLLNGGRAGHKVEAVNGKLYSMGGWRRFKFLDQVEEYDPLLNKWRAKAKMPQPMAYFGSIVRNDQIYVIGGISGFRNSDEQNSLLVYSPKRNAWASIEPPMTILKGKVSAVLATDI